VTSSDSDTLWVSRLGMVPYTEALSLQDELREARGRGEIPDVLLLLEHPPVYTRGRRTRPEELPMGAEWYGMQGIEVAATDRGGAVTYHGPGQLVAYPIVDLSRWGDDVHAYVRRLEETMIAALAEHGVAAQVFEGLTGVWTAGEPPIPVGQPGPQGTPVGAVTVAGEPGAQARKIGSIGIHVSRGITTHGLAVNVANDLQPFEWIVPCGIEYVRMTSLSRELGSEQSVDGFGESIASAFAGAFRLEPVRRSVRSSGSAAAYPGGTRSTETAGSASE
jgi:lipoyl(octanoyl) transferase